MPFGAIFSALFFFLLAIAALTSAVALFEVVVSYFTAGDPARRKSVTLWVGVTSFVLAVPTSLSMGVWSGYTIGGKPLLDALDFFTNNITMPLGGLLIAIFAGWVLRRHVVDELGANGALVSAWQFVIRFVAPVAIAVILIAGLI
jgi:NSS family neurotransmitter:Na+ symporter